MNPSYYSPIGPGVRFLVLVVFGPLCALGGFGLAGELRAWRQSTESLHWRQVPGRMIDAHVDRDPTSKTPTFTPSVLYAYNVDGRSYSGRAAVFGSPTGYGRSLEIVAPYHPEDRVTVWVEPGNPENAVLQPNSWGDEWQVLFFLLLAGGAGAVALWGMIPFGVELLRSLPASPDPYETAENAPWFAPAVTAVFALPSARVTETTAERAVVRVHRTPAPWAVVPLGIASAVAGTVFAAVASRAWWMPLVVIAWAAASALIAARALPSFALALSSLAPPRSAVIVETARGAGYRGKTDYAATVDGRSMGPDAHRALFDAFVFPLRFLVAEVGDETAVVSCSVEREPFGRAESASNEPTRAPGTSLDAIVAALAKVLDVASMRVLTTVRLPAAPGGSVAFGIVVLRAISCLPIASTAHGDLVSRALFGAGCAPAIVLVEALLYRHTLERYRRSFDTVFREIREYASRAREQSR
jgi:hypothetical protein